VRRTCPCKHRLSTHRAAQPTGGPPPRLGVPEKQGGGQGALFSQGGRHPAALGVVQAQRGGEKRMEAR